MEIISSTGRRKTAVARVYFKAGKGAIQVNNCGIDNYFKSDVHRTTAKQALAALDVQDQYDVTVKVGGGGHTGQAEAIRLGMARALVRINQENKASLKKEGFLTRDPRMVERKKYGRRKARKKFQFSKR